MDDTDISTADTGGTGLPPIAEQVYIVIQTEGPLTNSELCEKTGLSADEVREAFERLAATGLLDDEPTERGCRESVSGVSD